MHRSIAHFTRFALFFIIALAALAVRSSVAAESVTYVTVRANQERFRRAHALAQAGKSPAVRISGQGLWITRNATASLLTELDTFCLSLVYHGAKPERYKPLYLSVKPAPASVPASYVKVRITETASAAIIGHLATTGMLYRGSLNRAKRLVRPEPCFTLSVSNGKVGYVEHIPWTSESYTWHGMNCPPLLDQLAALRLVITGDAASALDALFDELKLNGKSVMYPCLYQIRGSIAAMGPVPVIPNNFSGRLLPA